MPTSLSAIALLLEPLDDFLNFRPQPATQPPDLHGPGQVAPVLYNERPAWLNLAHRKLAAAVAAAYGFPADMSDDQILERPGGAEKSDGEGNAIVLRVLLHGLTKEELEAAARRMDRKIKAERKAVKVKKRTASAKGRKTR
ncbi:MAG: hypothetical protein ABMA26_16045 [Limisphaerales bacterium]